MPSSLVILDRDGVINEDSAEFIKTPGEWIPLPGSAAAIARLNDAGFKVGVATNQSGIGRGLFDTNTLNDMHQKMANHLLTYGAHIDKLVFCPDHPDQPGPNRKPAPGMALQLLEAFSAKAEETWFVGDSLSDVFCAINAKCKPVLVKTGKGKETLSRPELTKLNVPVYENLAGFVDQLLN